MTKYDLIVAETGMHGRDVRACRLIAVRREGARVNVDACVQGWDQAYQTQSLSSLKARQYRCPHLLSTRIALAHHAYFVAGLQRHNEHISKVESI